MSLLVYGHTVHLVMEHTHQVVIVVLLQYAYTVWISFECKCIAHSHTHNMQGQQHHCCINVICYQVAIACHSVYSSCWYMYHASMYTILTYDMIKQGLLIRTVLDVSQCWDSVVKYHDQQLYTYMVVQVYHHLMGGLRILRYIKKGIYPHIYKHILLYSIYIPLYTLTYCILNMCMCRYIIWLELVV